MGFFCGERFFLLFFFAGFYLLVLLPLTLQVSIVGIIRGFAPFVTNIRYSVDDMTGPPLNVKQWVNTEASSINRLCPQLQLGKEMCMFFFLVNY